MWHIVVKADWSPHQKAHKKPTAIFGGLWALKNRVGCGPKKGWAEICQLWAHGRVIGTYVWTQSNYTAPWLQNKRRRKSESEQHVKCVVVVDRSDVMWCDVMWCDVMWCAMLCCAVLCCAVLCCGVVWCGVVWCDMIWCDMMWCDMIWCDVMFLEWKEEQRFLKRENSEWRKSKILSSSPSSPLPPPPPPLSLPSSIIITIITTTTTATTTIIAIIITTTTIIIIIIITTIIIIIIIIEIVQKSDFYFIYYSDTSFLKEICVPGINI